MFPYLCNAWTLSHFFSVQTVLQLATVHQPKTLVEKAPPSPKLWLSHKIYRFAPVPSSDLAVFLFTFQCCCCVRLVSWSPTDAPAYPWHVVVVSHKPASAWNILWSCCQPHTCIYLIFYISYIQWFWYSLLYWLFPDFHRYSVTKCAMTEKFILYRIHLIEPW